MTDRLREAAQAALYVLDDLNRSYERESWLNCFDEEIESLRAALAEQDAEPVAWCWKLVPDGMWHYGDHPPPPPYQSFPLYTHPPRREWQGLTSAEAIATANSAAPPDDVAWIVNPDQAVAAIACAVEAALKEKNHDPR